MEFGEMFSTCLISFGEPTEVRKCQLIKVVHMPPHKGDSGLAITTPLKIQYDVLYKLSQSSSCSYIEANYFRSRYYPLTNKNTYLIFIDT